MRDILELKYNSKPDLDITISTNSKKPSSKNDFSPSEMSVPEDAKVLQSLSLKTEDNKHAIFGQFEQQAHQVLEHGETVQHSERKCAGAFAEKHGEGARPVDDQRLEFIRGVDVGGAEAGVPLAAAGGAEEGEELGGHLHPPQESLARTH